MRKLAANDVLEILQTPPGTSLTPRIVWSDLQAQDQRAKLVFQMLHSWGLAAYPHQMMGQLFCEEHKGEAAKAGQPVPAAELVIYACELVDAAWSELRHRGWILEVPSLDGEPE